VASQLDPDLAAIDLADLAPYVARPLQAVDRGGHSGATDAGGGGQLAGCHRPEQEQPHTAQVRPIQAEDGGGRLIDHSRRLLEQGDFLGYFSHKLV
jgi:hypothetical protein